MLKKEQSKQMSFYSSLYDKIPEKYILKAIDKAVDFSFVNELLANSYSRDFGRPAKEPKMMMKLQFSNRPPSVACVVQLEEPNLSI